MPRAKRVCPTAGCPELTDGGRCEQHRRKADLIRGTARDRGYNSARWRAARGACLRRDPLCVCADAEHPHGPLQCLAQSTVADHWPDTRKALLLAGVRDPDAPHRLRGICAPCHNRHTAHTTPGGWAAQVTQHN